MDGDGQRAPGLRRAGRGGRLHRHRWAPLPRRQRGRHVDVLRLRPSRDRRGGRAARPGGDAVPAADPGGCRGRRRAGGPLSGPVLAVHPVGEPGERRGDPGGPRRHRARGRAAVRRPLPRPLRRGADRSAGRPARPRPAGAGEGDSRQGPDRTVQRSRGSAARPGGSASIPTSSRSASRSRAACLSGPTG